MENSNGQLQVKYQKIAAEYSKVRAQANVLKKAVIDEQARSAELREQLKVKEVEVRRAEQELDSLTFRNQQLTKRITFLQEELDKNQNRVKKGRSKSTENKSPIPVPPNHILDEEFQKKIVENAQLLSQISDKDNEIENLNDRIRQLEFKLDICEKSKIELDCEYQNSIDKLEREKNDLQRRLNEKQKPDETVSWSSNEGRKDTSDADPKIGFTNHRQIDISPFSSPSASRRSSKSLGDGRSQKQDDTNSCDYIKFCNLEKELNYWKAQYNVIKIKYDEVEEKEQAMKKYHEINHPEPVEISNMLGKLNAPFAISEEIESREAKIKEYFLNEIDRLIDEKHIYHVKNIAMAANSEVMHVRLDNCESKKEKCETALSEALSNCTVLQKDKDIQEGNYKTQLNTMSEHLANMNEKLICQTEEIQQLKFELANKNGRKGKQK